MAFIDLAVDKQEAFLAAKKYLAANRIDITGYRKSIIFSSDDEFDRYLQHTAGLKAEEDFIAQHDYELFLWRVRFFKELQKEEYVVLISSRSGKVVSFFHLIDDIESRQDIGKDGARQKAELFLNSTFNIDLNKYDFHEEKIKRYDKRIDYLFSWEKKGVFIPWKEGQGGAKLLTGVTVSGNEIREFYKNKLSLPEKFFWGRICILYILFLLWFYWRVQSWLS